MVIREAQQALSKVQFKKVQWILKQVCFLEKSVSWKYGFEFIWMNLSGLTRTNRFCTLDLENRRLKQLIKV